MKKSLIRYNNYSAVSKDIKAGNYVVAELGYLFKDVNSRRADIIIEGDIAVDLTNKFKVVDENEANLLIQQSKNPVNSLTAIKKENEELKKKVAELESKLTELESKKK